MPKRKTRDSDCCSVNFLKYVLHIYNFLFALTGVAVLGVGVWTVVESHQYTPLLASAIFPLISYVLIAAGLLVLLVFLLGCCSVCREHRSMLVCFTFLLSLIFLLEAMAGILSYVYEENVEEELKISLNSTMLAKYHFDEDVTSAMDTVQQNFKCCGIFSYEDWRWSEWRKSNSAGRNLVPDSCCISPMEGCGVRSHPSNIHTRMCIDLLEDHIRSNLNIAGGVGLGFCVLQIFGMVFSCCLYVKLKNFS